MQQESLEKQLFWVISIIAAILTIIWCLFLGAWSIERVSLALATCSAAFAIGSLLGFIFSIFGEELEPLGKIRDAIIALASGIAGVSIANLNGIGSLIGSIQILNDKSAKSSWFSVLFAVVYFVAGFYFMYLMRKLVLNPALAKSRIELERIQISGSASMVAVEVDKKLPQNVRLGREYIEDLVEDEDKYSKLRTDLFSTDVEQFLMSCETDLEATAQIPLENIGKAAILHYYRIFFIKDEAEREKQQEKAIEWINRALLRDPLDPDFWIKLADVFAKQERYDEAVSILQRLERDVDSPQYVQQWLGYFLLFIDGREQDAIKHSLAFHKRFPDEADGLFNAACGYAQLYTSELRQAGVKEIPTSENRIKSLAILEDAVRIDPENRAVARKHTESGDSFEPLASDVDFLRITSDPQPEAGR